MFKFIFAFHIFVLEGSLVNRIDSQFVFDSLVECRTAEMLIQTFGKGSTEYVGFVEGSDFSSNKADVIVTDGFS